LAGESDRFGRGFRRRGFAAGGFQASGKAGCGLFRNTLFPANTVQ
jgi:hypothetical protein